MLCPADFPLKQRRAGKKQAWPPKCAAPRMGYEESQKATYYYYLSHINQLLQCSPWS